MSEKIEFVNVVETGKNEVRKKKEIPNLAEILKM